MITSADLGGMMAMMPAFATDDAAEVTATDTIAIDRLEAGLNRMIGDGADVIATTGSFGEFHTLLPEEYETIVRATAEVTARRVPLFIGATGLNTREVLRKAGIAADAGADGVLIGVPFYFPSSPDNAVRFFRDVADAFPKLGIMVYHNPPLHNVTLGLGVMREILKIPSVVAMKDSHRDPRDFMQLMEMAEGRLSMFVNLFQYATYAPLGAPGFWSFDCWMGPWPQLALRDAVARDDLARATDLTKRLGPPPGAPLPGLSWRETAAKIRIRFAGYADPGPLRPPFVEIPPELDAAQRKRAAKWQTLCEEFKAAREAAE